MCDVLAVVTDLFFQSRISAAARSGGASFRFITSDGAIPATQITGTALVDLDAHVDVLSAIRALKCGGAMVVAFGPHVDTELRKSARAAGADRVLAKSKFVTDLPKIIQGAVGLADH